MSPPLVSNVLELLSAGALALLTAAGCANSANSAPGTNESESGASSVSTAGGAGGSQSVASGGVPSGAEGGAPATGGGGASNLGTSGAGGVGGSAGLGGAGTLAGGNSAVGGAGGAAGGGGAASVACPGIPIVPDTGGFVAPGSNTLGIHGSWFVYSDCPDQNGKPCSTVVTPPANMFPNVGGKMCTSGMTSTATGAWGAGIALELNDGPPQQPFDTTAHGIKGFCLVLSGSIIPSTGIRVAFPTKNNPDNVYFEAVSTPGQHTVLFADTAQGSWVTNKVAFEPTKVMLLQLQIPSATTAPVPWNFCVEGLTAITE